MSLIEMNSIYKSYRNIGFETQVLNDITLHINEGDYVCLLYTAPSPRDATLSRMPSSA